jgi:DNA-3-methyladenine glycosylase II
MAELQRKVDVHQPLAELPVRGPEQYFWDLCESILGQQLSEKVAPQIITRVRTTLNHELSPEKVLSTTDNDLRAAGVSYAKISYLKNVATAWQNGNILPQELHTLDDETVIEKLITIKGVGRWTAEMFLIFTLGRKDIFSAGDYGLRRAILLAYGLPPETKPKVLTALAENWSPHRSLASRILWKSLDLL